jgi:hypothetical protein
MATDVCGKLVDDFNNFDRLHDSKRKKAVRAPHDKLCCTAESSSDCDRTSAVLSFLQLLLL